MGVAWFNYRPTRKMYIVVKAGEGKPTLEYLCWTLEFLCRNSNVQCRNSNVGFFISAKIFAKFDDFSMYIVPINDDKFIQIIKIIKLGKNLGRNEKTHIGILPPK